MRIADMPVNVEDSIRLILHGRWLRDFTIPVVDQASFLILHSHLSFANALLSTLFRHHPTWSGVLDDIPLALECVWAQTGSRPPNAPSPLAEFHQFKGSEKDLRCAKEDILLVHQYNWW